MSMRIESIRAATDEVIAQLADVLLDAVDDNAGISFMKGLTRPEAAAWWRTVVDNLHPRAVLLVARDGIGKGGAAEKLYTSLGWSRVGEVPHFALNLMGRGATRCSSTRSFEQTREPIPAA